MKRRDFVQGVVSATAFAAAAKARATMALAGEHPSRNTGIHFSVMLWALADHASFSRCLEIVAAAGYSGVELTGEFHHWSTEETERVLAQLQSLHLTIDAMSGVQTGFAVPEDTAAFQAQFTEHLRYAQRLRCSQVILLSGKRSIPATPELQRTTAMQNLRWAGELAAKAGIEIVIEPIDLLEDPHIYLASVTDAFDLVRAIALPQIKVLFDVYHEQRSFGNLLEKLERNLDLIGLVHIADVPGRHEPGSGEIAYTNIYRALAAGKYKRWIAMEYYPTGDPITSLQRVRESAEAALTFSC